MRQGTDAQTDEFINGEKKRLLDSVCEELEMCGFRPLLPSKEAVMNARKHPLETNEINEFFPPPRSPRQSQASHLEQSALLNRAKHGVTACMNPAVPNDRNLIVVGGPGVGKTAVCQFLTSHQLCLGLNVTATSVVAERSKQLGGTHVHRLVSLKGSDNGRSPGQLAETAIREICRKPESLAFLKTLDCLNLDEFGTFSAEMLAILDVTMRCVRGSTQFMGGVFIFCALNHLQLMPFNGTPAMMYMCVVAEFNFIALKESVRAANDPALQETCTLTRTFEWNETKTKRFRNLLTNHCKIASRCCFYFRS
jgi:hypothetical protein